jgi:uncharacterized protein (DUF849 family)
VSEPLTIVAAVNGGMQVSRDGAKVPITPEEIAEEARLWREAGQTAIDDALRDGNGTPPRPPEPHWSGSRIASTKFRSAISRGW